MTSTSTPKQVRLSITITPEVHAAFQRFSAAAGMSMSRAIGEWLGDTLEAVEFTAGKMEDARSAPKLVLREMHAYALGLADETGLLMQSLTEKGRAARAGGAAVGHPPSSNTGGKGPSRTTRKGGELS